MEGPEPRLLDVLAQRRTDLAAERTLLAAYRTLMSWVRTALAMIGFGFTIYKLLQATRSRDLGLAFREAGPKNVGLFLIGLGTLAAVVGSVEYWQLSRDLHRRFGTKVRKFPLVMAGLIFALGLGLFLSIVLGVEVL